MRIVIGIAALVAIVFILWLLSLLIEADNFTRSEWAVEHQVQFKHAWRAVWSIELKNLASSFETFLSRFWSPDG